MGVKIVRKFMTIFGTNAGTNQRAVFGSLFAGAPAFTTDPETIQSLANYLQGWYSAAIGGNAPAIEDMNAMCFLFGYQLAYLLQQGVPEYSATTEYFIGGLAASNGTIYQSVVDNNLNHALTDTARWAAVGGKTRTTTSVDSMTVADNYIRADPTAASFIETLPALATVPIGQEFLIKNVATNGNFVTLKGNGSELIDQANTIQLDSLPVNDAIKVKRAITKWDIV